MVGRGGAKCECPPGYSGAQCQDDPCSTRPCKNNGVCSIGAQHNVQCACPHDHWGDFCQNTNSTCRSGLHCFHDGACIDRGRDSFCLCKPNYYGIVCHIFDPPNEASKVFASSTTQSVFVAGSHGASAEAVGDPMAPFVWDGLSSEPSDTTERREQVTFLLLLLLAIIAVLVLSLVCLAFVIVIFKMRRRHKPDAPISYQSVTAEGAGACANNYSSGSQMRMVYTENNFNTAASIDGRARSPSIETGSTNCRGVLAADSLSNDVGSLKDVKVHTASRSSRTHDSHYKMQHGKSENSLSSSVQGGKNPSVHTHDSFLKRDSIDSEVLDRLHSAHLSQLPPSKSAYCFFQAGRDAHAGGDAAFPIDILQGTGVHPPPQPPDRRHLQSSKSFNLFSSNKPQLMNATRGHNSYQKHPLSPLAVEAPLLIACSPHSQQTRISGAATAGVSGQFCHSQHLGPLPGSLSLNTSGSCLPAGQFFVQPQQEPQTHIQLSTFDASRRARGSAAQVARDMVASVEPRTSDYTRALMGSNSTSRDCESPPSYEQFVSTTDPNESKYRDMQLLKSKFSPSSASSDCESTIEHDYTNVRVGPPLPPKRNATAAATGTESVCSQCDLHENQAGYFSESEEAGAALVRKLVPVVPQSKKMPTPLEVEAL